MATGGGPVDVGKTPTKKILNKRCIRCFVCGKDVTKSRKYFSISSRANAAKEYLIGCVFKVLKKTIDGAAHICYSCCHKAKCIVECESVVNKEKRSIEFREVFHNTQANWEVLLQEADPDPRMKRMISSPHGRVSRPHIFSFSFL